LHLFTDWASTGGVRFRKLCLTGAATLIWAMWTRRNDLVFDNSPTKIYMQVLFLRNTLVKTLETVLLKASGVLETLVMQISANFG
jgi:hypothetical protein